MPDQAERKRLVVAWAIVLGAAIAHRLTLFLLHRTDLAALIAANRVWYVFQYLPREMLRDQLFRAMLLLQQTPPVQNLVMGLALKGFEWPAGVATALIALQSLGSILTAGVLVHLLSVLYPRRVVLWTALGLVFVLSTDLVVLEYNNMGQLFYEPLSMLGTLVLVDALVCLRRSGRLRCAVAAGMATGVLVMTRATWYLFPVACLVLVAMLAPARRMRAVLACLVPILVLQGGWAIKNYAIYGVLSPATSAWGGLHALAGLRSAGLGQEFDDARREWQAAEPAPAPDSPQKVWDREAWVERTLGLKSPVFNTLGLRIAFARDQRDFFRFVRTHPATMLRKWWKAYHIFWQPIANYGRQFVGLFVVSNRITNPFDFPGIVRQLLAGSLPDVQYVASGSHPLLSLDPRDKVLPSQLTPTTLYTVRWIEPVALMLQLIAVHLLLPLVAIVWAANRLRRGRSAPVFDPLRMTALLVGATLYGYLAATVNLIETSENMRYRLEVEPVIWVITLICVTELAGLLRGRWGRPPVEGHPLDDQQATERRQRGARASMRSSRSAAGSNDLGSSP